MKVLAFNPDLEKDGPYWTRTCGITKPCYFFFFKRKFRNYSFRCTKGIALETIAERLGVKMENVMAIGDN